MIQIIFTLFLLFSDKPPNNILQQESKLSTGWYYILQDGNGVRRLLDKTQNFYFIDSVPILTAKNIREIYFRTGNDGRPYLEMKFDSVGTKAWRTATGNSINKRLGFIFNDKLIQAALVNSEITVGIAAIWNYSKGELEHIKENIQSCSVTK